MARKPWWSFASAAALALLLACAAPAGAAPGDADAGFGAGGTAGGPGGSLSAIGLDGSGRIVVAGRGRAGSNQLVVARRLPDGSPDPSFGDGGQTTFQVGGGGFGIDGLVVAADGSIVVLGRAPGPGFLAMFTPAGALNPAFGEGGIVRLDPRALPRDLALAPDGAILVSVQLSARPHGTAAVARFTPRGGLDGSWGSGGIVATRFGAPLEGAGNAGAGPLAVFDDGSFVLGGSAGGLAGAALARFTSAGAPDPGFGQGGALVLPARGSTVDDLAARPDGGVIALIGNSVSHVTAAGVYDAGFGVAGGTPFEVSPFRSFASAVAVAPDGAVLVAGTSDNTPLLQRVVASRSPPHPGWWPHPVSTQISAPPAPLDDTGVVVARLTPSGAYDCSFGNFGRAVLRRAGTTAAKAEALAVDDQGRVLTAGEENAEPIGGLRESQLVTRMLGGSSAPPAPTPPLALTRPLEQGSASGARVGGFVDPRCADTSAWVEYGPTPAYGSTTPVETLAAAAGPRHLRPVIAGLARGVYHYRVVAQNGAGRAVGEDASFEVPVPGRPPRVHLRGRRVTMRKGAVRLRLDCRDWRCSGTLTLLHRRKRVGSTRFEIPSGRTRHVTVKLGTTGRKLLRRHRSVLLTARLALVFQGVTSTPTIRILRERRS